MLAFDEAHKAKGAAHNQPVGKAVVKLQETFPKARVVYLSATGATQAGVSNRDRDRVRVRVRVRIRIRVWVRVGVPTCIINSGLLSCSFSLFAITMDLSLPSRPIRVRVRVG